MREAARVAWSLELSALGLLKSRSATAPLLSKLPAGTKIYLPAFPTDPPAAIEDALRLIRQENAALEAVPHVAASREASLLFAQGRGEPLSIIHSRWRPSPPRRRRRSLPELRTGLPTGDDVRR